jgi:hypothetical protein
MIRKIGKTVATIIGGIIPAFSLMLVMSSIAWALSGGTNITLENGTIALSGQLACAVSADPTATINVSLVYGDCVASSGSPGNTSSNQTVALASGQDPQDAPVVATTEQAVSATTGSEAVCVALSAVASGNPAATFINCTIERTDAS